MTKPTSDDLTGNMEQLLQLLQSDGDQAEILAGLSAAQRAELQELQAAAKLLDAWPEMQQAGINTPRLRNQPTPAAGGTRTVEPVDDELIGHYEVLETLGSGGFGVVVKARDRRLGRLVALKIPRLESLASGEIPERFAREARLVAMLGHPAIVPVYETGADGHILYIASAYCNGGTLAKWFHDRERTIDARAAGQIIARLAEAIQHAHVRGVIHRDLKPGNVLLDLEDGQSTADIGQVVESLRVTDFGLATFVANDQSMTQSGATIGTPAYMSPEQARGAVGEISERSDIYALGAMLYELLAGRPPIVAESNVATMRAIETRMPASIRSQNGAVPQDLEAICLKCLEKDPAHRYPSAQDLQDDLQRWLDGQPVAARPIGAVTRMKRWIQRNPAIAIAVCTAFLALAIGFALAISFGLTANQASRLADARSTEALTQARLARKAVDDLQRAIASEPLVASQGMESFRRKLLQSANDYYQLVSAQQPNDDELLLEHVEILNGLAGLNASLGERTTAIEIYDEAIDLMESRFPNKVLLRTNMMVDMAQNLTTAQRHDEAIAIAQQAVDGLNALALKEKDSRVLKEQLRGLVALSGAQIGKGNIRQASDEIDEAILLLTRQIGEAPNQWPEDQNFAKVLQQKTAVAVRLMNHDDTDHYAPLALDIWQRINSQAEADLEVSTLQALSEIHSLWGASFGIRKMQDQQFQQLNKERAVVEQLIALRPEVASHHAQSANQLLRHAKGLYESGDVAGAKSVLADHLPEIEANLKKFPEEQALHITTVLCYQLSAKTFRKDQDLASANNELNKAIGLSEAICQRPQVGSYIRMILATLYMEKSTFLLQQSMRAAAAEEVAKGLDLLEELYEDEPVGEHVGQLEFAYSLYGLVMNKLQRYEEYLERSEPIVSWPRESPSIEKAKTHRVVALAHCNRLSEARRGFEQIASNAKQPQSFLNMCGLASRCAAAAGMNSAERQFFLEQSLQFLKRAKDHGVLEQESVIRLIQEHPDFAVLRELGQLDDILD